MSSSEIPQLYLITPPSFALDTFPDVLARLFDTHEIACLRLRFASEDTDEIARAADALRAVAHARDIALVIDQHAGLVTKLGLDGVHLSEGAHNIRALRKELGEDAIIGSACGTSRHDGMNAGEAGADYVSFGPVTPDEKSLGEAAPRELFSWWSDMIEVPVVAEGGLTVETVEALAPVTDFFGIGAEIWSEEDPSAALAKLAGPLR